MDEPSQRKEPEKKSAFENLDRDELIRKCKGLLGIAQKAKKAKDEYAEEIAVFKEKLNECNTQKQADKECLKTMQLMVDSLTEQKLNATTRLSDLERHIKDVSTKLIESNRKYEQIAEIEIENEAQKKQIKRLTQENEEQEMDLKSLDEKFERVSQLSQRQTQEILVLEQSIGHWKKNEESHQQLLEENRSLLAQLNELRFIKCEINETELNRFVEKNESQVIEHKKWSVLYEKAKEENEIATENTNKLIEENKELKEQINVQLHRGVKYKLKLIEFSGKLKQLKQSKELLTATVTEYSNSIAKWQNDISDASNRLCEQVNQLQGDHKTASDKLQIAETTARELHLAHDTLVQQIANLNITEKQYNELFIKHQSLNKECQDLNETITKLKENNNDVDNLRHVNQIVQEKMIQLENDVLNRDEQISAQNDKFQLIEKQNEDLLTEMRELNDALKNRGNVISKQTVDLNKLQLKQQQQIDRIKELEDALAEKSKSIEQLRTQFDNQSDILSTSTISRTEEVARMRDIEDSFEEKYNKLRSLAIKLKKKNVEQQATISKLETMASPSTPVSADSIKIQNLKSIQVENDRLMDTIDTMKAERKKLNAEIAELNANIQKLQLELQTVCTISEDAKALAETYYKTKCALEETIRNSEKQMETICNENKSLKAKQKDLENEIFKIKDELKLKENIMVLKMEQISKLTSELNKIRSSIKKSSVLNLEVEAYEKSSKEIAQKLATKAMQLIEMETANKSQESTIEILQNEVKILNENFELKEQSLNNLQQEIALLEIKVVEGDRERTELRKAIDDHVTELNSIKIELANLQCEKSQYEIEKQKLFTKLQSENEKNVGRVFSLEEEVRNLRTKLNECNQDLENVQTDFSSYKIRAQSVLRQNQSKDSSIEEELKEELALLSQSKEDLTMKLNAKIDQNCHLQNSIDELKNEKQSVQERCKKLLELLDETHQQIETLHSENRMRTQEHQEALKIQRLQIDTLNNCYKKQIDKLQQTHDNEIEVLKLNQIHVSTEDGRNINDKSKAVHQLTDEQRIEMILTERQAGEGSESTGSLHSLAYRKISNTRNRRELIPLDELLNGSFEDNDEFELNEPGPNIEATIEKLAVQHSRVKHLSSLLSEAELDVARLTQLNDVLKEEVRRQERSTEREMHMHNLEYMKNIIFKFLTINNADERAHLVPVLNTILKLSSEESKQLQLVAKGGDGAQLSWSNILPMW